MSVPTNYTELQTVLASWINRSDLTSQIPEFIRYFEDTLNRDLRLTDQETTAALTLTSGTDNVSLPSGFADIISLIYTDTDFRPPRNINIADLDNTKDSSSGMPEYYAISDKLYFNQTADQNYALTMRYWLKWDIATDSTNSLLTNNPEAYLYGSLLHGAHYLMGHKMWPMWEKRAEKIMESLQRQSSRRIARSTLRTELGWLTGRRYNITQDR
jgi:hypothetical protein